MMLHDHSSSSGSSKKTLPAKMNELLMMQTSYWDKRQRVGEPPAMGMGMSSSLQTSASSSSSSSSRHRLFNRRIVELDEAAAALASGGSRADSSAMSVDQTAYVRLLASKNFDTQRLLRQMKELPDRLGQAGPSRGKFQGSNVEGYISHHQDIIVLDAINKAKVRTDEEVEHSQRAGFSWRQLMGTKSSGLGSDPALLTAPSSRIIPTVSYSKDFKNDVHDAADGDDEVEGEADGETDAWMEEFAGTLAKAARSDAHHDALRPFTSLGDRLRAFAQWEADSNLIQYTYTLELLALMVQEKDEGGGRESGRMAAVGFSHTHSASGSGEESSPLRQARKILTDGALSYYAQCYLDPNPDENGDEDATGWRHVYLLLRTSRLRDAERFLEARFTRGRYENTHSHQLRDDSQLAEHARRMIKYLIFMHPSSRQEAVGNSGIQEKPTDAECEDLHLVCYYLSVYRDDPSSRGEPYLRAVCSLLMLLTPLDIRSPDSISLTPPQRIHSDEDCASEMPGSYEDAAGASGSVPDPDIESFLFAKLWFAKYKRLFLEFMNPSSGQQPPMLISRDPAGRKESRVDKTAIRAFRSGGQMPPRLEEGSHVEVNYRLRGRWYPGRIVRVMPGGAFDIEYDDVESDGLHRDYRVLPPGEETLYMAIRESGGAAAFEYDCPHHYVRALLCCHRFGEAIAFLHERGGAREYEAVELCCACLYFGLIAAHSPLDASSGSDLTATRLLQDLVNGFRTAQDGKWAVNYLTLLAPPVLAPRVADGDSVVVHSHSAFADAIETLFLTLGQKQVKVLAAGSNPYLLELYPQCPVEVLLVRAGVRMLSTMQNVPAATFFYGLAGKTAELCSEVAFELSRNLLPGKTAGEQRQRDFWYSASIRLMEILSAQQPPQVSGLDTIEVHHSNLRVMKDFLDCHFSSARSHGADVDNELFSLLDKLQLPNPNHLQGSDNSNRAAVQAYLAPLDPKVAMIYELYAQKKWRR